MKKLDTKTALKTSILTTLAITLLLSYFSKAQWFKTTPYLYATYQLSAAQSFQNFGDMSIVKDATAGVFDILMVPNPSQAPNTDSRFSRFTFRRGILTRTQLATTPTGSTFAVSGVTFGGDFILCRLTGSPDVTCTVYAGSNLTATPSIVKQTGITPALTYAGIGTNSIVMFPDQNRYLIAAGNNVLIVTATVDHQNGVKIVNPTPPLSMMPLLYLHLQRSTDFVWVARQGAGLHCFNYTIMVYSTIATINSGLDTPVAGSIASFDLNPKFAIFSVATNAVNLVDLVTRLNRAKTGNLSTG